MCGGENSVCGGENSVCVVGKTVCVWWGKQCVCGGGGGGVNWMHVNECHMQTAWKSKSPSLQIFTLVAVALKEIQE